MKQSTQFDPTFTTGQVAHLIDVHTNSVKRWIFNGELKAELTTGRRWKIKMSDLVAFVKARVDAKEAKDNAHLR